MPPRYQATPVPVVATHQLDRFVPAEKYGYDIDMINVSSGNLFFGINITCDELEDYFHFGIENDVDSVNMFIDFCKNVVENQQYYSTNTKFSICATNNLNQYKAKFSCKNNIITFRYEIRFSSITKRITLDNFMPIAKIVYEDCRHLIE